MPYSSIAELPDPVKERYSARCQRVFMEVFNSTDGDEATKFKVAHTAAGRCKDAGKAERTVYIGAGHTLADYLTLPEATRLPDWVTVVDGPVSKAADLDPDEMQAWFEGRIPRALLAIPFSGPFLQGIAGKGLDLDGEFFDERTDIKPDWFEERPVDWHHSMDPSGKMNGALIGKARNLRMEDDGWWVDLWLNAGEKRLALVKRLAEKGAELFGSSYAYPNLVKRERNGHIAVWPYMMQTLSTSPQNIHSVHRPAKAVLDVFDQADISVQPVLRDLLTELDAHVRDLPTTLLLDQAAGESAAKAGRELSGANLAKIERLLAALDELIPDFRELRDRVVSKYNRPGDVSSN